MKKNLECTKLDAELLPGTKFAIISFLTKYGVTSLYQIAAEIILTNRIFFTYGRKEMLKTISQCSANFVHTACWTKSACWKSPATITCVMTHGTRWKRAPFSHS